jgi:hypothetical protein
MEHLVPRSTAVLPSITGDPVANLVEVGKLLGIEMEEIAGCFMLIPIVRFFFLEGGQLGSPRLPKPEAHGGAWHTQLPGDADSRLAPPPSTYGLDDEPKLVASRQAMRLAGAILKPRLALHPESLDPFVSGPLAKPSRG